MASQSDFEQYLRRLRGDGERLIILVEDCAADTGWRIVTEAELVEIGQSFDSNTPGGTGMSERLCYNVAEAARAVGVSEHKIRSWLRRDNFPLPHIQDDRRILIPRHLLLQWLSEEAARNVGVGEL